MSQTFAWIYVFLIPFIFDVLSEFFSNYIDFFFQIFDLAFWLKIWGINSQNYDF